MSNREARESKVWAAGESWAISLGRGTREKEPSYWALLDGERSGR